MSKNLQILLVFIILIALPFSSFGQGGDRSSDRLIVNEKGLLSWKSDGVEASFFGVNYSTPFAYAYRAHKRLGVDLEEAIQNDVYHMARMGMQAFRVHVWDTEISDIEGNLLENEHLRLFDFLLGELNRRGIKTIITPIAFWGNGYPEPNEDTPGFSHYYGRARLTTDEAAILAQENYLTQFFEHINPYTGMTYQEDPGVVAVEINNEPDHSGPKSAVTAYVNSLHRAIVATGFDKPIFYNISQGPYYADAVAKSNVDGFSFQWYPSGLVSGKTLTENFLPHVNEYRIPFDSISEFNGKPKMVYEFDAADIMEPYMYPAMARSFREAGFQWATQFAYDPLHIAHTNTEYQTHYLNLLYTPRKAISMLIAANAFTQLPLGKSYGSFPENNSFEAFEVSFDKGSSEMNTNDAFYHTDNTSTAALEPAKLKHIAGVGSSPLVQYNGNGAYFLDEVEEGIWRLEVLPDAIQIRDPFAKTSPERSVTELQWYRHDMEINLSQLGINFNVIPLNSGNDFAPLVENGRFEIYPGTYLLTKEGEELFNQKDVQIGNIGLREFVAPKKENGDIKVYHQAPYEVSASDDFHVTASVIVEGQADVMLSYRGLSGPSKNIKMTKTATYTYEAKILEEDLRPGILDYWIKVDSNDDTVIFPENISQVSLDWYSEYPNSYRTFVASENSDIIVFDPSKDRNIQIYPNYDKGFSTGLIAGNQSGKLHLLLNVINPSDNELIGLQYGIKEKLANRLTDAECFVMIEVEARVLGKEAQKLKVGITDKEGRAWTSHVSINEKLGKYQIPFSDLSQESAMLLPRPFPGFMPLHLNHVKKAKEINWSDVEKIQISLEQTEDNRRSENSYTIEVGKILIKVK